MIGGIEDISRQALVEGKNLWELDLERLGQTAGIAGIGGVFGAWTEYRADCRRNAKQTKKYVQREVEVEKEVWTAVKEKKLAFSCRNGHVGCEKLENIFPVYVEDTKWVKKTVKQKELVGKWEYGWEYNGSDRSFTDYLEEYLGKTTSAKTQGDAKVPSKMNLQFFANGTNTKAKNQTVSSTLSGSTIKNNVSWRRGLTDTNEIDINDFLTLKNNGTVKVNSSGSNRPLYSKPNSYYSTGNGEHVFVYDGNGELIYDVSIKRMKGFKTNIDPLGNKHFQPYKLIGGIPQKIKQLFGWR